MTRCSTSFLLIGGTYGGDILPLAGKGVRHACGGQQVVSVPIPEVAALAPLVRLASDAAGFEREIEEALRAFAREHTWEKRFEVWSAATASRRS